MWWMTGIAEKCNIDRSPHVNQAILLLAFADWMRGRKEKGIRLVTDDLFLANCLVAWGQDRGISCVREKVPLPGLRKGGSGVSGFQLFRPLRALSFLARRVWARKALRGVGLPEWRSSQGSLTFVTYLFNHAGAGRREGFLQSPYWGELPRVLQKKRIKSNWLHLYLEDSHLPSAKDAARVLGSFKKHGSGIQTHATLDSFISMAVLWRTMRDWWCLQRTSRGFSREACFPKTEGFDFWPLFREEWRESLAGPPAISNLLSLNLFEAALQSLPRQKLGVYLQENLGWEMAMLTAWRQSGHGRIIGFPHSTVRFWDLRYFHDSGDFDQQLSHSRPKPDLVATNGPPNKKILRQGGYPAKELVEVEALRYPPKIKKLAISREKKLKGISAGPKIVILGDYAKTHTHNQMELLHTVADRIPHGATIVAKPHPACPIRTRDYPNLSFSLSSWPLGRLFTWADVVYASSTTSSALDAISCGVPVIVPMGNSSPNLSPIRGIAKKCFVQDGDQLAKVLSKYKGIKKAALKTKTLFYLNPGLKKWKRLLCSKKKSPQKKFS